MTTNTLKNLSNKFCPRFGQLAVDMGYITEEQLKDALCLQVHENISGNKHRMLGTILFEKGWLSSDQVDTVMNSLMETIRKESGE